MKEFNPERVTIRIVFSSLLDKSLNIWSVGFLIYRVCQEKDGVDNF